MQLVSDFSATSLNATNVGDLVYFSFGGRMTFAIVLAVGELNGRYLAILNPEKPFHTKFQGAVGCLSYGGDWAIEPLTGPESDARNRRLESAAGAIHLAADNLLLSLDPSPDNPQSNAAAYDLTSQHYTEVPAGAVPFLRWKLWGHADDRNTVGRSPLLEMTATAPD